MAASFAGLTPYNFGFNTCPPGRRDPTLLSDPNGECPVCIGALIGLVSGYFSGKAAGLKGGELIGFMFGNGLIGALSGGIGSAIGTGLISSGVNSIVAGGIAGASAGAVAGFYGTALAGGNPLDGLWKGALTGLIGGGVGSSLTGAGGAIAGGASAGATGAALNGGDIGQVGMGALAGGAIAGGLYMGTSLIKFSKLSGLKEFDELSLKNKFRASRAIQKTLRDRREYGFKDGGENGYTGLKKGIFDEKEVLKRFKPTNGDKRVFRTKNGSIITKTNRVNHRIEWGDIGSYDVNFHTHVGFGPTQFSGNNGDLGYYINYNISNAFMMNGTEIHFAINAVPQYIGPTAKHFNLNPLFLY